MFSYFLFMVAVIFQSTYAISPEPACSKFDFEEKVLSKLIVIEHRTNLQDEKIVAWETTIKDKLKSIDDAETERIKHTKASHEKQSQEALQQKLELEKIIQNVQKTTNDMTRRLADKETAMSENIAKSLKQHEAALQSLQENYQTPTVVFTAKFTTGRDVTTGQVIKFKTPVNNVGEAYDPSTGYFTAPYNGTYLLHTSVCSFQNKWVIVHIMAAGEVVGTTGLYNGDTDGTCTSSSGMAVLSKGDKAWVQGSYTYSGALYADDSRMWSSFSGMLIHTDTV